MPPWAALSVGPGVFLTLLAVRVSWAAFGGRFLVPSSPVLTSLRRLDGLRSGSQARNSANVAAVGGTLCRAWESPTLFAVRFSWPAGSRR